MNIEQAQAENISGSRSRRISLLAVFSMVSGFIIFIPFFSALTAIILGIISLYDIAAGRDILRGKGFAITGIVLGLAQLSAIIFLSFAFILSTAISNTLKYAFYPHHKVSVNISSPKKDYGQIPEAMKFLAYNNAGFFFQKQEKYNKALGEFRKALKTAEKEAGIAYYGIGSCYMGLRNYPAAISQFNKAIAFNPVLYDAYQNKAVTLRLMGKYQESVDACKKTISLFPDFPRAYCSMGWAYEYLGEYKKAIDAHLKALRLAPRWRFPIIRINSSLGRINDPRYRENIRRRIEIIIHGYSEKNKEVKR